MTCPNCGHRVRDGAKFCDECGIVLPEGGQTAPSPRPTRPLTTPRRLEAANASTEAAGDDPAQYGGGPAPEPVDINRARRMLVMLVLGLVAVLCFCCAVAVAAFAFLSQNPPSMVMPGLM